MRPAVRIGNTAEFLIDQMILCQCISHKNSGKPSVVFERYVVVTTFLVFIQDYLFVLVELT